MAVRIRSDLKTIVCAAKSEPMDGDTYIGDGLHYTLGVELLVFSVCGVDENGAELWGFYQPLKNIDEKIKKEQAATGSIAWQKRCAGCKSLLVIKRKYPGQSVIRCMQCFQTYSYDCP